MLAGQVKSISERTCWAEFRDGFEVKIRYLTKVELESIRGRVGADGRDASELIAKEVIKDWRRCSSAVLRKMIDMEEYPDEVPYDADDAAELLRETHGLEDWVMMVSTDLSRFSSP